MYRLYQRYLAMALLRGQAHAAGVQLRDRPVAATLIRADYSTDEVKGLLAADALLADIQTFTYDLITSTAGKPQPVKQTISLAQQLPVRVRDAVPADRCDGVRDPDRRLRRALPGDVRRPDRRGRGRGGRHRPADRDLRHADQRRDLHLPGCRCGPGPTPATRAQVPGAAKETLVAVGLPGPADALLHQTGQPDAADLRGRGRGVDLALELPQGGQRHRLRRAPRRPADLLLQGPVRPRPAPIGCCARSRPGPGSPPGSGRCRCAGSTRTRSSASRTPAQLHFTLPAARLPGTTRPSRSSDSVGVLLATDGSVAASGLSPGWPRRHGRAVAATRTRTAAPTQRRRGALGAAGDRRGARLDGER